MNASRSASCFTRFGHAGAGSRAHAFVLRMSQERAQPAGMPDGIPLFTDQVPFDSGTEQALHRIARECARPLAGQGDAGLRVTMLHYRDGERDLIVVGDRAWFDQPSLQHMASAVLTGPRLTLERPLDVADSLEGALPDALVRAQLSPLPRHLDDAIVCACALTYPVQGALPPEHWLAALAWVLQRAHAAVAPAVAVSLPESADAHAAQVLRPERYRLVDLALPAHARTTEALEELRSAIANAPWVTDGLMTQLGNGREASLEIDIGVVFEAPVPTAVAGADTCDYVSGHAPIFPLTLHVGDTGSPGLVCRYDGSRYSASTVEWLLRCVAHVAVQFAGADQDVDSLNLLSEADMRRIMALGRGGSLEPSAFLRIEDVFAQQAAQRPDAVALVEGERSLTYAEVDARSRHMASVLAERGVVPGAFVGLALPRSLDVVVAMLAILRCGATYVPMDPDYPTERLRYTAQDASVALVITPGGTTADFGAPIVDIAALMAQVKAPGPAPEQEGRSNIQAAYVIYTSGSTGRPKGVIVPHRNVLDLIRATQAGYALSPADTWTLFHSSAFDFSVWEIWGCLLTGGRLVIVPHDVSREPEMFIALLNAEGVTVLNQTPSAFYQLIEADERARVADSLRLVIFGGEALDMHLLLPWFDRHPPTQCRLVNMFGITETTVHVTWKDIDRADALRGSRSVGRALPGWHLYVMNSRQQVLPPGSVGEIHVGGVGVASCYHARPDLTATRFLPDPCTGGVMYRSGDCGRLGDDGTLEHLGRLDSQVKLRGFRIELDEIRRVVLEHPGVKAAAVLLNQPDPKDAASARIDAYVVADETDIAALRERAMRLLPQHMMPATFARVERMPMTVNGKLDADRLRRMEVLGTPVVEPAGKVHQAASNDGERMRDIWQDVLGRPIDVDDNFFDLGGNSLIGIRIASAMRKQGLPPLPLAELYTHQTVRKLVAALGLQ